MTIIDEHTMNTLVSQDFLIGDMARGTIRSMIMLTETHQPSNYIKMSIIVRWGIDQEYYNVIPDMTESFPL